MRTHKQIIDDAGGAGAFHDKLGLDGKIHTVRSWAQRNSIPADHWPDVVRLRLASLKELTEAKPPRKQKAARPEQGVAA